MIDRACRAAKDQDHPLLKGRVDADRVGVAGHSYGAYTALSVVGQVGDTPEERTVNLRDERVKAALAMSPQHPGKMGLGANSWNDIRVPAMTMTGTKDAMPGTPDAGERKYPFTHMPPGDKYFLLIKGAKHFAFSDNIFNPLRPFGAIERDPRHHDWIARTACAFFDAYLKGEARAKEWLESAAVEKLSGGECTLEKK